MDRLVHFSRFTGPWGPIWIASTSVGVCAISLRGGREALESKFRLPGSEWIVRDAPQRQHLIHRQLEEYFRGERQVFELELDLRGTPLQIRTWRALMQIPYGETRSYLDIASAVGNRRAVRAVGQANGRNPVPIIVPCHRVIRANGDIGGFGAGPEIKEYLLALERRYPLRRA